MDISGAQINSAVLDSVASQAQPATQGNNRVASAPAQPVPSAEVTLSRDARERANQPATPLEQFAAKTPDGTATSNVSNNPAQPASQNKPASEELRETIESQLRESEVRTRQDNEVAQSQANSQTYTARLASQSYTSVSNF